MASQSGALWDDLYNLYLVIAIVVGGLVVGWLTVSLIRFRARPGMERPHDAPVAGSFPAERGHPAGSYVMAALIALIMFGLAFSTIGAINTIETPPADPNAVYVDVVGYQFGWTYTYAGVGGVTFDVDLHAAASADGDRFIVPEDRPVILNITSSDVWHNFALSDFRLRVDAIPGTVNRLWFNATESGEYRQACVQICGVRHANMWSIVKVVPADDFEAWRAERSNARYDELATSLARDPTTGRVVNATISDTGLALDATTVAAGRPVLLQVNNSKAAAARVILGDATHLVPAGASQRLWLAAAPGSGELAIAADGQTQRLQVVSQ